MNRFFYSVVVIVLWLSNTLYSHAADENTSSALKLLGAAEYREQQDAYYIGVLYAQTATNNDVVLSDSTVPKRMEINVLRVWSPKRFADQWSQALLRNHSNQQLIKFGDAIVDFQNLLGQYFLPGDKIEIISDKLGVTHVSVNTVKALEIKEPGFLDILLAKWVGSKPPSQAFKVNMLSGEIPVDLQHRLSLQTLSEARINRVSSALKPQAEQYVYQAEELVTHHDTGDYTVEEPVLKELVLDQIPVQTIDSNLRLKQQQILKQIYVNAITKKVQQHMVYPSAAIKRKQQGYAELGLILDREGNINHTRIIVSSEHKRLNQAALESVKRSGKLPPMPASMEAGEVEVIVPLNFKLSQL